MTAPAKPKPRHGRGAPILVRFADGPMAGRHMTVMADSQGQPPSVVNVAIPPDPIEWARGQWRDAPTISQAPKVATYHLLHPLDTVPWSYLYAIQTNGA